MKLHQPALAGALLLLGSLAAAQEPPQPPPQPQTSGLQAQVPLPPHPAWGMNQRLVRHSPALMGGGIALIVLGALSAVGATLAYATDNYGHGDWAGAQAIIVGMPLTFHALGCFAGGIPMYVIGARMIPAPNPLQPQGWMPSLKVGRSSATLQFAF